jgi:hypothetical protein
MLSSLGVSCSDSGYATCQRYRRVMHHHMPGGDGVIKSLVVCKDSVILLPGSEVFLRGLVNVAVHFCSFLALGSEDSAWRNRSSSYR